MAFRELDNIVCINVSSTFRTIVMYDGTPYFYSFRIYLYDTYYVASSIMDMMCIVIWLMAKVDRMFIAGTSQCGLVLR